MTAGRSASLEQQHGDLLRANTLFAGLDGVALAKLAARLEVVRLGDGENVVSKGEPGDALYVVSRGRFGVFNPEPSGETRLRTCERGEIIGEMALLTEGPRSATVRAEGEAEVLRLDRAQFEGLVRQDPSVPLALAATLSSRLRTAGTAPVIDRGTSDTEAVGCGESDTRDARSALAQEPHSQVAGSAEAQESHSQAAGSAEARESHSQVAGSAEAQESHSQVAGSAEAQESHSQAAGSALAHRRKSDTREGWAAATVTQADARPVAKPASAMPRDSTPERMISGRQLIGFGLASLVLLAGWLVPAPHGFSLEAWHAAATFLAIVPLMACGSLPDGAIALVLVATWVLGGVASPKVALAGFASGTWVLTIAVFVVGAVIASSGLLFRLALWAVEHARGGFKTETLALCLTGWLSSAAIPNPSGRMLLIAPAITEMAEAFGYAARSRGATGLAMAGLLGFGQTVAPFLTSSTTTLLTFTLLPESSRIGLGWGTWALRAAPVYAVLGVGMLAFILWRYSPRESTPRRMDALPVQRALLGSPSRHELVAGGVALALLGGFATQPIHHIDPAWVAVAALGVLAALGLVTPDTLRAVNWNYALLFGTLASVVDVFASTSLDQSVAGLIAGAVSGLSGSPLLFVAILTLVCFAASFVLRFAAAAPMLTVALSPVAASVGVDPWVVAIVALVGTSGFFLPYQSSIYQAIHQELNGNLFDHRQARPFALMYGVLTLVGLCASVPVWHAMGLL